MKSIVLFPNDSTIYPYLLIVEITIGYLTLNEVLQGNIYNSRNYYRLLNFSIKMGGDIIYNSRNYYRLLNVKTCIKHSLSTTVEITIGYLTMALRTKLL